MSANSTGRNEPLEVEKSGVSHQVVLDDDVHTSQRPTDMSIRRYNRRMGVTAEETPHDITFRPGLVQLYSPPMQRQRWGEAQVLPRINWGDLFFDLYYVAATYNVSNIIVKQPDPEGMLYAAGTFLPLMTFWMEKTIYDGRFATAGDDVFHRLYNTVQLCVLGLAVLHVRPVEIMANSVEHNSMLIFCCTLIAERVLAIGLYMDLYFRGVGQRVIKKVAIQTSVRMIPQIALYTVAAAIAAIELNSENGVISNRRLAEETDLTSKDLLGTATTAVPILLVLVGYLVSLVQLVITIVCCFPGGGRHKDKVVPVNVEFMIHRNGEWIMLMLGESIFSILIVNIDNEGKSFYLTFYFGVLAVAMLQLLHFSSQPHDPDRHAIRRNKNAGVAHSILNSIYSFMLVALGAAYTVFLTNSENVDEYSGRRLAGEEKSGGLSREELLENAAKIFCFVLASLFLCLDVMEVLHVGLKDGRGRCVYKDTKKKNYTGILLLCLRCMVIAFTATLPLWVTEPEIISPVGAVLVVVQLVLRKLGAIYLRRTPQTKHTS